MFCEKCGKEIKETEKFCPYCGVKCIQSDVENVILNTHQVDKQPKLRKKVKLPVIILVIVIVLVGLTVSIKLNDSKYIDIVKEGHVDGFPNVTVEDAFEQFFGNPKWSYTDLSGKSKKGIENSVEFKGECEVYGELTGVSIWFVVDDETNTFVLNGGYIEGNPEEIELEDILYQALVTGAVG